MGRLGLDYEALAAVNPDLIYCSISGFGQTGPWSKKMTYDPLVQSSTGMVAAQGRPESQSKRHSLYNGLIVDKTTAMTASQAILAALYARDAKGRGGQHIDLSMYDVGFAYNWVVRCSPASICCAKAEGEGCFVVSGSVRRPLLCGRGRDARALRQPQPQVRPNPRPLIPR